MKTLSYTYRISTSAKQEAAFAYIADITRHPEWNGHLHVTALTPGEIQVVSKYHSVGKTLNEERHNDIAVTFRLTSQNGGTLVERTITVHMSPMMAILWNLLLFPLINKRENNRSMAALKGQLDKIKQAA